MRERQHIAKRAYLLWDTDGQPERKDLHYWLKAEKQLQLEQSFLDVTFRHIGSVFPYLHQFPFYNPSNKLGQSESGS